MHSCYFGSMKSPRVASQSTIDQSLTTTFRNFDKVLESLIKNLCVIFSYTFLQYKDFNRFCFQDASTIIFAMGKTMQREMKLKKQPVKLMRTILSCNCLMFLMNIHFFRISNCLITYLYIEIWNTSWGTWYSPKWWRKATCTIGSCSN